MMFLVIGVSLGLLLFVPILIDYAILHYTRRVAQTAADAAALAAAIEYADRLSINTAFYPLRPKTETLCCACAPSAQVIIPTRICVLRIYEVEWVERWGNWYGLGEGYARYYARRNESDLVNYWSATVTGSPYRIPRVKFVYGYPIEPVAVWATVKRTPRFIYGALYGRRFEVKAHAIAEAYLDQAIETWSPCDGRCKPPVGRMPYYDFQWKVRLVE